MSSNGKTLRDSPSPLPLSPPLPPPFLEPLAPQPQAQSQAQSQSQSQSQPQSQAQAQAEPQPQPQRRRPASAGFQNFAAAGASAIARRRQLERSEFSLNRVAQQAQGEEESLLAFYLSEHFNQFDGVSDGAGVGSMGMPSMGYPPNPGSMGFAGANYSNAFEYSSPEFQILDQSWSLAPPPPTPQQEFLPENPPPEIQEPEHQSEPQPSEIERPEIKPLARQIQKPRRGRRPRAEEFASAATAADRVAAFVTNRRRNEKKLAQAHKKQGYDVKEMQDWQNKFKSNGVSLTRHDWYGTEFYGQSHRGGTTVAGTEDTMDLDDEEAPPAPKPDFETSIRWKQRGAAGLAKARWASARYKAKKKVMKTAAWLEATPEERERMETEARDSVAFVPDHLPVGPVPPRSMEPWLRSEREVLLRIIDQRNRSAHLENKLNLVTEAYNKRMEGVAQKKGELCIAIGNGQSRKNSQLTEDRTAPVRSQLSIQSNLIKWINQGTICDCREHQRYLVGDFENSGGFPYGHGVDNCVPPDREDACACQDHLRDYNGNFPEGHGSDRCGR
ncbi:hypothetical protein NHQ30_010081 [Ciborinia camelliae]|nr:hypothetical protein NHQ30_010081 [Ciborinia camelliae]